MSTQTNFATLHDDATTLDSDRVALIEGETGRRVSYGELSEKIARAGNALTEMGVEKSDRVGLFFPNELAFVYAFFGAIRLGAVPVPINIRLSRPDLKHIVTDSDPKVLVTSASGETFEDALTVVDETAVVDTVAVASDDPSDLNRRDSLVSFPNAMAAASSHLPPAPVTETDPALQSYTSGTTSEPKGVVLTHDGCIWNVTVVRQVQLFDEDDRAIVAAPLYHKNAMIGAIKPLLQVGGSIVIMDGFDPEAVIEAIPRYDVTFLRGVPAMFKMLVSETEALSEYDTSCIKWAVSGSATLSEALVEDFKDAFGAPLGEAYGLTEGGPLVTMSPRWGPRKIGSAGLAFPGVETIVVDPDTGEEVTRGEIGELLVLSPGVASYHDRPEAEAEAFEHRDGKRFLHTKDLARKDEQGYHYIVGRLDDMLVVGGENVHPAKVENRLQGHEAVKNVAVVGAPHSVKNKAPVAFVVASEHVTEQEIKEFAIEHGPAYAHPRRVFFEDSLPLAGTGKVDRDELRIEARERIDEKL